MEYEIRDYDKNLWPKGLSEIPRPPKKLFIIGRPPPLENFRLCIIGSRKYTSYGKSVCEKLLEGLRGHPFTIVSGLAIGIDGMAHREALKNNLNTVAIVGSGLSPEVIYPSVHKLLAKNIVDAGGAIISENKKHFRARKYSFPERNRLMVGMSDAVLVIEATNKSGTLITSKLATDYNRDVLTVPGSIFSENSFGPHMLLRLGATPVTSSDDILEHFNLEISEKNFGEILEGDEKMIFNLLKNPLSREEIYKMSSLSISKVNEVITLLELKGCIEEGGGVIFRK